MEIASSEGLEGVFGDEADQVDDVAEMLVRAVEAYLVGYGQRALGVEVELERTRLQVLPRGLLVEVVHERAGVYSLGDGAEARVLLESLGKERHAAQIS